MLTCEACGCCNFEKFEGFMYCTDCQTQTQDYYEREHEFVDKTSTKVLKSKKKKSVTEKRNENDIWTSWDIFNYILYGMTNELKMLGAPENFHVTVLNLWITYLQRCNVAFKSNLEESKPKLRFLHRVRDERVLYNVNVLLSSVRKKRNSNKSRSSGELSSSGQSVRRLKKKMIEHDYEQYSLSQSSISLANVTLDSLGRSSDPETQSHASKDTLNKQILKDILQEEDYNLYKKRKKNQKSINSLKNTQRKDIRYMCKNRLLAILHSALMLRRSEIQLGDLIRFIRESHLSFAKVTHFFPEDLKLGRGDASFIESISDSTMPTHLGLRKAGASLLNLLGIKEVPLPDIRSLISRYCCELNLPETIAEYSQRIFTYIKYENSGHLNPYSTPNFEAKAIACIIFIMKLLFGLDGKTEILLSDFAEKFNSVKQSLCGRKLFVFNNWQKHLQCRKTVINDFDYPTQEKLGRNSLNSSKNFIEMLVKESKDEYRGDRFVSSSRIYGPQKLLTVVKETISSLTEAQAPTSLQFPASLKPQSTYLKIILETYENRSNGDINEDKSNEKYFPQISKTAQNILRDNFEKTDVEFVLYPEKYLEILLENDFHVEKEMKLSLERHENGKISQDENITCTARNLPFLKTVIHVGSVFDYWILNYPKSTSRVLNAFRYNVFEKTSTNFQWFLSECSRMLEMNSRDVYNELLKVEHELRSLNES